MFPAPRSRGRTLHASHPRLGQTALRRHDAAGHAARRRAGAGGAVAAADACGCRSCRPPRRTARREVVRQGEVDHPDSPLRLAQPAGVGRSASPMRRWRSAASSASIPSSLPGCQVCELLPNMAKVMDRTTVLRSLTHPYPIHGVAYALTGVPAIDVAMELRRTTRGTGRTSARWWSTSKPASRAAVPSAADVPPCPATSPCPFRFSTQRDRRSAAGRPVRGVPGQPVRSALGRLSRHGDQGHHQDAPRHDVHGPRSVRRRRRRLATSSCPTPRSCSRS